MSQGEETTDPLRPEHDGIVEARRLLALTKVKRRPLNIIEGGETDTAAFFESLTVRHVVLAPAVVKKTRPKTIICENKDCRAVVKVAKLGRIPSKCAKCTWAVGLTVHRIDIGGDRTWCNRFNRIDKSTKTTVYADYNCKACRRTTRAEQESHQ